MTYYKILPGCPLFDAMQRLRERGRKYDALAQKWVREHFGEDKPFGRDRGCVWGGVGVVQLDRKPSGWKYHGPRHKKQFRPHDTQVEILKELKMLPTVHRDEIRALLNYEEYEGTYRGSCYISFVPSMFFTDKYILIKPAEFVTTYKPVKGMIEILGSEYIKLKGIGKKKTVAA